AAAKVSSVDSAMQQNSTTVNSLQASVTDLREKDVAAVSSVRQIQLGQEKLQKSFDEPVALHYKGILITPGGFIAGESIWRQRAMNDDIYTAFNTTPYKNSGEAYTSE